MMDVVYSDNFDLGSSRDVADLKALVLAEAVHWASGGRSTEMFAVYGKKFIPR
jgi:hypothetical protein